MDNAHFIAEQLGTKIHDVKNTMIDTLQALLQIESVGGEPVPSCPFGEGPEAALNYMLSLAASHGFSVARDDGYAGHVDYGDGDEYIAVLAHLDVVPAGTDWTFPPFGAFIRNGKIYARGAIDDKGPAMSALWALILLKQLGLKPKRKIRLILGLDEENEWRCMKHYFSMHPLPLAGFSPDAEFPLIYSEKGLATLKLQYRPDGETMLPFVVRFEGGERLNMVPDYAYAVIEAHSETAAAEWEQRLHKEARNRQIELDVSVNGSRLQLVVHGKSAHGSTPEAGVNAVIQLAVLLSTQSVAHAWMWRFIAQQDTSGKGLGIAESDEEVGDLTANLGRAAFTQDTFTLWFDVRYPRHVTPDELTARCRQHISDKWHLEVDHHMPPLYVPLDSPVVQVLSRIYTLHTGQQATPLAIGGATYARAIPNAVAFGPLFPGEPDTAHQRDECWSLDNYFRCTQIYAHAMYELANTL
ncbi:MAG: dipeptidase PepV [Alicyclobacillus sp.]|nr:dipeptidase PepV [Alicyclobacillus sp.]